MSLEANKIPEFTSCSLTGLRSMLPAKERITQTKGSDENKIVMLGWVREQHLASCAKLVDQAKHSIGNCKVGSPIFDSADLSEYLLVLKMCIILCYLTKRTVMKINESIKCFDVSRSPF